MSGHEAGVGHVRRQSVGTGRAANGGRQDGGPSDEFGNLQHDAEQQVEGDVEKKFGGDQGGQQNQGGQQDQGQYGQGQQDQGQYGQGQQDQGQYGQGQQDQGQYGQGQQDQGQYGQGQQDQGQ